MPRASAFALFTAFARETCDPGKTARESGPGKTEIGSQIFDLPADKYCVGSRKRAPHYTIMTYTEHNAIKMLDPEFFSIDLLVKTKLPPLPASIVRISAMLSDFNTSQSMLADAISIDPILSTRLLRLANSAIYGLHGTVTSVAGAVSTVGYAAISEILMMSGVSDAFGRRVLGSPTGKEIWQHSLATAMVASEICRRAGFSGADDAFSCGLLHDIGKLIFLRADAPAYTCILSSSSSEEDLLAIEQGSFGFDHAELGAAAADKWKLPSAVCHMIRNHHQPDKATKGIAMAHVLNIADVFVMLKMEDSQVDELLQSQPAMSLGLNEEVMDKLWAFVSLKLNESTQTFS